MNIEEILTAKEGENFEFKTAENRFSYTELQKYACAISNEGGGKIVFGITDKRPRQINGSKAFEQPERTRKGLIDSLRINVDFEVFNDGTEKRVLVFIVPARPIGLPVQVDGVPWWRDGDSLVPMPESVRQKIYEESGKDFSAEICKGAVFSDLDPDAIETFRKVWIEKRGNKQIANVSREQLLRDCEALNRKGEITYAALILFGTHTALGEHLANSETIFEYRASEAAGPAGKREEYREGFFSYFDRLWNEINARNLKLSYQDGFFLYDVYAYNERAVREAVLNAVCHRNYQLPGSVFVRQYNDRIEFESPGGFPSGITVDNILDRQSARNRRLAEIVARCGLVERSGQGMNLIFEESIKDAKELPNFAGTDAHFVRLRLGALITDPVMIRLFKEIGEKTLSSFSTDDFRVVRYVMDGKPVPRILHSRIERLVSLGVLERVGRSKVLVSRQYYKAIGKGGTFTRLKGLDNGTNKELLMRHMKDMDNPGLKLSDFQLVLPSLSIRQIQWLLKDLEATSRVYVLGRTRAARWFLGKKPPELISGLTSELTSIDKSEVIKNDK